MPLPVLWVIVCAAAGVTVVLRPEWWAIVLACLALLAGLPPVPAVLISGGLWLAAWGTVRLRGRGAA